MQLQLKISKNTLLTMILSGKLVVCHHHSQLKGQDLHFRDDHGVNFRLLLPTSTGWQAQFTAKEDLPDNSSMQSFKDISVASFLIQRDFIFRDDQLPCEVLDQQLSLVCYSEIRIKKLGKNAKDSFRALAVQFHASMRSPNYYSNRLAQGEIEKSRVLSMTGQKNHTMNAGINCIQ
ncbi:hypothetical protein Cgig2_029393 [Carnegiea gigantea]|uniref:Uncharacterized protein n=1 Tax=Carnegiea gigantea TaxID=171969 RepID=A0A9Q1QQJ4_9CARY|nr:hypothetical protein Cgig2_029393 [Carnegiea gigantea]